MAADNAQENGPPLTELESLQLKANNITDESLESTRRMIALCEDSQASGSKTLEMLEHQGEQLHRIEEGMDNMNSEMKAAEKHLTGMEKWCGLCVCPWNRAAKVKDIDGGWENGEVGGGGNKGKVVNSQPSGGNRPDGPIVARINDDAREDEMEENMQAVHSILGNLKNMASDMGNEIDKHNTQVDRINVKASHVDSRIGTANKRTEKLLK